ncbi:PAS domain S-box protein [Dissulfurirhabdus thermomarina]|uniref:Oxygen sensor histidine kinase NreB n=1 Tax=Dissulfurirhabdus thermomarina TaxID=1765737 RepID=A0A6N9TMX5_DISTH|nr:PAS domain-containing sensor histidine kinase [Dissulfurirhabdus thermomarina]NDY41423.1 PAS domain S-box protein [Dissulfurirhabdus thermomarina]NMX24411.1 PAS domain S-box protein [Dissulfurirhabdus thermomarina]
MTERDALFRAVADGLPDGLYVVRDGRLLFANPRFSQVFGLDPGRCLAGRDFLGEVYPDPSSAHFFRENHDRLLSGVSEEVAWGQPSRRRGGDPFWIEVRARRVAMGGGAAVMGVLHDATECKRISDVMAASQRTLSLLFDAMEDRVYVVGPGYRIAFANRRMQEDARADLAASPCYRACWGRTRPCPDCHPPGTLTPGGAFHWECRDRRSGAWFSVAELPVRMPGVEGPAKLVVARDISARKAMEERARALSRRLLTLQEAERRRLSRELHDDLGQRLNAVKIGLDMLHEDLGGAASPLGEQAARLREDVEGSIRAVRELSSGLRPAAVERLGLVEGLAEYCGKLSERHGLRVDFQTAGMAGVRVDEETAINLFRIVQEALHNVVKHAGARRVSVRMVATHPVLRLQVKDDGRGFDVAAASREARFGLGLAGMAERVDLLRGSFRVVSRPGGGTLVSVEVPFQPVRAVRRNGGERRGIQAADRPPGG